MPGISKADNPRFELLHLWLKQAEDRALEAIRAPLIDQGVEWSEHKIKDNFYGVKTQLSKRLSLGIPPSGAFWLGGPGLRQLVDKKTFRLIPNKTGNKDFSKELIPEVFEVLSHKQGITALPVGIHLQNYIVYNKKIMDELNLSVPQNWDQFIAMGPVVKQAGYDLLSMSDEHWQLRFLFPAILIESLNPEEFTSFLNNNEAMAKFEKPLKKAFTILQRLKPFANENYQKLDWEMANKRVIENKALANVLGDFTSPLYPSNGQFLCELPPGNQFMLWSVDVIALVNTNNRAHELGQEALMKVGISHKHMQNYIAHKGGLPVLKNMPTQSFNDCTKNAIKMWKTPKIPHVFLNSAHWARELNALADVVGQFFENANATPNKGAQMVIEAFLALR